MVIYYMEYGRAGEIEEMAHQPPPLLFRNSLLSTHLGRRGTCAEIPASKHTHLAHESIIMPRPPHRAAQCYLLRDAWI